MHFNISARNIRWCTVLALQVAAARFAHAQTSAEAAVRTPVTWAEGAGAPTVRTAFAPMLSLNLGRSLTDATRVSLDTRISNASIQLTEGASKWSGGTLTLVDVVGTLAWKPLIQRKRILSFEGGAGISVFAGSRTVAPFRDASRVAPVGEGTVAYDLPFRFIRNTTAAFARGTVMRAGGSGSDDAVQQTGYVTRFSFGIRITHQ